MSKTFEKQVKTYGPRRLKSGDVITAEVRYDDQCHNGHNTFSVTGTIYSRDRVPGEATIQFEGKTHWCWGGGCCHAEIAEAFPELAGVIKWHLCSSDGPLHYVANTVYHAGDRDHNGLRRSEARQLRGKTGQLAWIMRSVPTRYHDGDAPPTDTVTLRWEPLTCEGGGKARELDLARSSAVWPDATDAELMQEPEALKLALLARLPALLAEFRRAVESLGFQWEPVA